MRTLRSLLARRCHLLVAVGGAGYSDRRGRDSSTRAVLWRDQGQSARRGSKPRKQNKDTRDCVPFEVFSSVGQTSQFSMRNETRKLLRNAPAEQTRMSSPAVQPSVLQQAAAAPPCLPTHSEAELVSAPRLMSLKQLTPPTCPPVVPAASPSVPSFGGVQGPHD